MQITKSSAFPDKKISIFLPPKENSFLFFHMTLRDPPNNTPQKIPFFVPDSAFLS